MPALAHRLVTPFVAVAVLSGLLVAAEPARADGEATDRYIVTTTSDQVTPTAVDNAEEAGGEVVHEYAEVLSGFSAELTPAEVAEVRADPRVEQVVKDGRVRASANQVHAPWGLDRLDQRSLPLDRAYGYAQTGAGVTAFVIDSGIRAGHTQFGGRVGVGIRFANGPVDTNTSDCAGHGTHVAGIIGASTYGVAKGVREVPVRVLDCRGSGWNSDVIAGLDWVVAHQPAGRSVVNLSLGGDVSNEVDAAVARTVAAGIPVVVAAGNNGWNACRNSPARATSAITVAASDSRDRRASFSDYGSCVDLFAPGVSILSTSAASDTATLTQSGTSMAAPHVTGLVARLLQTEPSLTPAQISARLTSTATTGKITDSAGSPNRLAYAAGPARRVPAAPTKITVRRSDRTASATVGWTVPADWGTSPITGYKITRDGTDNNLRGAATVTVSASRRSATLTNLRGNRTYHLTIRAVNGVGAGAVAKVALSTGTVPLSTPTKMRVSTKSYRKRTAKVSWSVPTDSGGKKITGYRVYRSGKNTSGKGPYAKTVSAKKRSFTFTKLKRNTTYTLQVRARTGTTYGPKKAIKVRLTR
ncbi:MAG TPA: S8 family serine peptidase [Microlunatus sp.]|nr:S8 family serine peptidase [Microlunatus sp.]